MYTQQSEEDLSKEIRGQFKLAKQYLDPIHEKMNQQEELYRSYIDKSNYPHTARVFDPRIFRVIETVAPRMVANEPTGSFYPMEDGDQVTSEILNALIKYDWRRGDMFQKLVLFVKSMLIFGTAFGYVYYDYDETERTRMVPKEINGKMLWSPKNNEKIKVVRHDGPNFEPLNIYDCFFDPNATSLDNMRWFIYRTFTTYDELVAEHETGRFGGLKNLDKLKQMIDDKKEGKKPSISTTEEGDINWREHRRIMLGTEEYKGKDESNPEFVRLRRFTKDGWCQYLPEYDLVIQEIENPYFHGELPIVYGVDYPYPGELLGMGEIEPIDRIQRAINAVLNQRLDNVQLTLRTMWKAKKNSGVDMHTLVSAPGNIVTLNNLDDVERIDIPDVTGGTFVQTMNYLTASLQNGSGITDYTIGINTGANTANDTATGTRLIQQEANAQFKLKIQLFNHMVIKRIADQWKDIRIQYTTESQKLRILGTETIKYLRDKTNLSRTGMNGEELIPGDEIPSKLEIKGDNFAFLNLLPDDIQPSLVGDYDFIPNVSSEQLTDPIALQENFFSAVDRVSRPEWMQGLASQGKQLNFTGITEDIFEKLNIGLEGKDIITDMQQAPQEPAPNPEDQMGAQLPDMQPQAGQDVIQGAQDEQVMNQFMEEQNGSETGLQQPY